MAVGFNWFGPGLGWTLSSTAEKMAASRVDTALVAAYAPVCVDRFTEQTGDGKWDEYGKTDSWRRDSFIKTAGFATIPGSASPNNSVAEACSRALTKLLEARAPKK